MLHMSCTLLYFILEYFSLARACACTLCGNVLGALSAVAGDPSLPIDTRRLPGWRQRCLECAVQPCVQPAPRTIDYFFEKPKALEAWGLERATRPLKVRLKYG